jgi:hypothetical protein
LISTRWHAEPQEVKDIWHKLADQAKAEHKLKYPDYQYKPRKSSEKKRRMTKKKSAALAATTQVAPTAQASPTIQAVPTTTVSSELSGQTPEVDNNTTLDPLDLFTDAKLFAQGMFDQGYDIFHGGAQYYAPELLHTEDNAPVESDGIEYDGVEYDGAEYDGAEYDGAGYDGAGYGGNDTMDILFPRK